MAVGEGLSRRELLELGVLSGLAVGGAWASPGETRRGNLRARRGTPKNVIFMVADGMSLGVPSMAEPFSKLVRGNGTHWYNLLQNTDVAHGFFDTRSLSSLVTDSAAASTAWASGTRVFNGAINVLPDNRRLTPLAPLVRDTGRRVGLVTTTRITHATPAGFATVQPNRADEDEIAVQYRGVVDVLMGGGRKHFGPETRGDGRNVVAEFEADRYVHWHARQDVVAANARPEKVLGLFYDDHLPYTLDHRNQPEIACQVPTLAEMTRAALDMLARPEQGFLLQVEGGRVDHAAHANDAAAMLWDQLAFDDALAVVCEFAAKHNDTLVIVTSDHGNANPGLNGMGTRYGDSPACFERLAGARSSFESFVPRLARSEKTTAQVQSALTAATGIEISTSEADAVRDALVGEVPPELNRQHANVVGVLGQILGNHTGVGWTGVSHTEDLVLLTAFGPGADGFAGLLQNLQAYDRLAELWGIKHRNPRMSYEEAANYLAAVQPAEQPHWI